MTEKMKPSRIGWIKDIPESWKTSKVKFLATEPDTLFLDGDWIESDVIEETGIRYLTSGNVGAGFYKDQGSGYISEKTFRELHCLKVFPGDLMISRLNEPIGRACIVPEGEPCYVVAVDNVILRPNKEYDRKFIMYAMNTEGYAEHGNMIARGATMSRVSRSQLGQFWLAFPGISEQCAIADFLDTECAKIDSVIADIEKQIETLQKYKKSLITEAVTKGLDRSVLMKDSGTEWIGEIPAHWKVQPLKYLTEIISKGATPDDISGETDNRYTIRFIKAENIQDNKLQNSPEFYIDRHTNSQLQRSFLHENDVLFVIAGATIGKVALVKSCFLPSNINQAVCFLRFNKMYISNAEYFCYVLQSQIITEVIKLYTVQAAQPNLSMGNIANISVPVPEQSEMFAITAYLDKKLQTVEDIIANKKEELLTIQQHKKSLIYEYVTGKKRVTEVN